MRGTTYEPLSQEDEDALREDPGIHEAELSHASPQNVALRPQVYYNDGPFSAPSSVDESRENLLEKSSDHVSNLEGGVLNSRDPDVSPSFRGIFSSKRSSPMRCLLICLVSLFGLALVIGTFAALSYSDKSFRKSGSRHITMDHVFNGTFDAERHRLNWIPEAGDGVFSTFENGVFKLVNLNTNSTTDLLRYEDVRDANGRMIYFSEIKLSPDMSYVLLKTDYRKQWRWSSFGNYYLHNLKDHTTRPLAPPRYPPVISNAAWSPTGESIAFVSESDLYVLPTADGSSQPIRITSEGNSSIFFGVPDWVYEEEVFSGPSALWWSPDSQRIAFLRSDETKVNDYTFPIYNPTEDSSTITPYTDFVTMKYPKPGYPNPLVTVHVFDLGAYQSPNSDASRDPSAFTRELTWSVRMNLSDSIIQEVVWVANTTVLIKEVNRAADDGSVVICNLEHKLGEQLAFGDVVRKLGKNGEQGDDGWIDSEQNVYRLPETLGLGEGAYLDVVPNENGYNHIALFASAHSGEPRWLTSGNSEVTSGVLGVDAKRRLVYYLDAGERGIERRLFSVPIPADLSGEEIPSPTSLTEDGLQQTATYSASFSPQSGFYLLTYEGPNIPWQKVVKVGDPNYHNHLTNNERLNNTFSQFQAPIVTRSTLDSDGYEINTLEIRPPNMDDSGRTKYPVLFRVYNGPASQYVNTKFGIDWHHYLACTLKYIVVYVDGRGTGFKGRRLRNPVKGNLGYWETRDQINAARFWASKKYVDVQRIGIWGWSYGGYMSAKVVEANAGIHSLAISVAPVTSWLFYDTIYTERYMGLPDQNPLGYVNASINNVTGFDGMNYLLAHGSGDDNVHYANTAHLLDMLTQHHVRGFRFRMFTDSDHSISKRGANRELYEWMTAYLLEKWGKGGRRRG